MTAVEMFEELGWKKNEDNECYVSYCKEEVVWENEIKRQIDILKDRDEVHFYSKMGKSPFGEFKIDTKLLKAIMKQQEEINCIK